MNYFDFRTFYFSLLTGASIGFILYYELFHDKIHSRFYSTFKKKKQVAFFTLLGIMVSATIFFLAIILLLKLIVNFYLTS